MRGNTISLKLQRGRVAQTGNLFQFDYGQRLILLGVDLPVSYEVHFGNSETGTSKTSIGNAEGVDIPDEFLLSGEPVHVWLFLHDGESDGETEYHGIIGVTKRARPTNTSPTPVQQDVITQTIAALNDAVDEAESIAEAIPGTINDALAEAKASGEFDGKDGVDGKDGQDGYTPIKGVDYFDGKDGKDGADGHSPVVTASKSGKTTTISVDGETVATIADGNDGQNGQDGSPGTDGFSPIATVTKSGKVATISITDKNGTTSETVSDGADGDPSTIIDDAAGVGDTNKVWSASKSSTENGTLLSHLNVLEPTASSGDVGKYPKVKTVADGKVTEYEFDTPSGGSATDVQINGTSITSQGVANIPIAGSSALGVVKVSDSTGGLKINSGELVVVRAVPYYVKTGTESYRPITPNEQHYAVYYGLSKLAGEDLKNDTVTVGTYPEKSLSAISQMLNAPVSVSGSTPSITAKPGVRYVCGEVSTLTIVVPASGIIDVTFESGSTPTVLTVTPPTGMTMRWIGDDPTALEANKHYEINIMDGEYGVVGSWT